MTHKKLLMINNTKNDYDNINDYFQKNEISLDVEKIVYALEDIADSRCCAMKYLRQQAKSLKKRLVQFDVEINLATCQHVIAIHYRYRDWKHALAALPEC